MKKFLILILIIISAEFVNGQTPCQANFQYFQNPMNNTLLLVDSSNIEPGYDLVSNVWTIQGGGMSYTFTDTLNLVFQYNFPGPFNVCYYIITYNRTTYDTCVDTYCQTITLSNTCNLQVATQIANESVPGAFDGYINLTISGGIPPLTILWSTGDTTEDIYNLASGWYTVHIESLSDSSCFAEHHLWVGNDSLPNPCNIQIMADIHHVSVIGGNDGSIDLTVIGGWPPYHYDWSTGATTEDIANLHSGRYWVLVSTSDSACYATFETFIIEPYMDSIIVDTLNTAILDSCLGFQVDSFYIRNIFVNGNLVTVVWTFMGGGIVVELPVIYTFTNYGSQMVILTINCPFKKTLTTYSSYINIRQEMAIDDHKLTGEMALYPNPANNFLYISLPEIYPGKCRLMIFDRLGSRIMDTEYIMNDKVEVGSLQQGIYFIEIIEPGSGQKAWGKFIKN